MSVRLLGLDEVTLPFAGHGLALAFGQDGHGSEEWTAMLEREADGDRIARASSVVAVDNDECIGV
ncbi:MAG: hypothetical protein ACI9OJ_003776, partial [Myxococcota bacterium]